MQIRWAKLPSTLMEGLGGERTITSMDASWGTTSNSNPKVFIPRCKGRDVALLSAWTAVRRLVGAQEKGEPVGLGNTRSPLQCGALQNGKRIRQPHRLLVVYTTPARMSRGGDLTNSRPGAILPAECGVNGEKCNTRSLDTQCIFPTAGGTPNPWGI